MPTDDYKEINTIKDIMLKHIVFSENILLELAKGEIGTLLRLYSPIFGQDREEVKDFKNTLQTLGPAFIIEKLLEDDSFFNQITTSILIEHLAAIVQQHLVDPTQLQAHQKWADVYNLMRSKFHILSETFELPNLSVANTSHKKIQAKEKATYQQSWQNTAFNTILNCCQQLRDNGLLAENLTFTIPGQPTQFLALSNSGQELRVSNQPVFAIYKYVGADKKTHLRYIEIGTCSFNARRNPNSDTVSISEIKLTLVKKYQEGIVSFVSADKHTHHSYNFPSAILSKLDMVSMGHNKSAEATNVKATTWKAALPKISHDPKYTARDIDIFLETLNKLLDVESKINFLLTMIGNDENGEITYDLLKNNKLMKALGICNDGLIRIHYANSNDIFRITYFIVDKLQKALQAPVKDENLIKTLQRTLAHIRNNKMFIDCIANDIKIKNIEAIIIDKDPARIFSQALLSSKQVAKLKRDHQGPKHKELWEKLKLFEQNKIPRRTSVLINNQEEIIEPTNFWERLKSAATSLLYSLLPKFSGNKQQPVTSIMTGSPGPTVHPVLSPVPSQNPYSSSSMVVTLQQKSNPGQQSLLETTSPTPLPTFCRNKLRFLHFNRFKMEKPKKTSTANPAEDTKPQCALTCRQ